VDAADVDIVVVEDTVEKGVDILEARENLWHKEGQADAACGGSGRAFGPLGIINGLLGRNRAWLLLLVTMW
jgi:hypothetical protein